MTNETRINSDETAAPLNGQGACDFAIANQGLQDMAGLDKGDLRHKIEAIIGDLASFQAGLDLPEGARIVVAMSGGVDSSVTAALLHALGYDVVGLTLQLYDHGAATARKGACCAGQDIYDAKAVAMALNFPHYVMDRESRFRQAVIDDFAESYARGETPLPCVRCNQTVKFVDLLEFAKGLGAYALATGHYVQRLPAHGNQPASLAVGVDDSKDQSYFLFATTADQLDYLRFPLGGISKQQTRALAALFGLDVADKPDSQDICFVAGGKYADLVQKLKPEAFVAGNIVTQSGEILGQHQGVAHFTIGQRKGIGIGGRNEQSPAPTSDSGHTDPLYVIALNPERAEVIVGPIDQLGVGRIYLNEANWLIDLDSLKAAQKAGTLKMRYRHRMGLVDAHIPLQTDGDEWQDLPSQLWVDFTTPQRGVAPGQACVFYNDHQVIGGGWIARPPSHS